MSRSARSNSRGRSETKKKRDKTPEPVTGSGITRSGSISKRSVLRSGTAINAQRDKDRSKEKVKFNEK